MKLYFRSLKKTVILATKHPPAYPMDQMVGNAKTVMEKCGLFRTALLEFNAFLDEHKDWVNIKSHFGEAYENLISTGPGIWVP